jgi:excinuclease UvrABC nuclease subunit
VVTGDFPRQCGVYVWVLGRRIVYVGYAWNLRNRLNAHRRNAFRKLKHPRRHLIELARVLKAGNRVRIFITTPRQRRYNGLPVNTALGLEDGLIGRLKPAWNDLRKNPPQSRAATGL